MKIQSLGRDFLVKEYAFYKQKAFDSYERKKINECLRYIEYCGLIAWFYPILEKFCDDELESLLIKLSVEIHQKVSQTNKSKDRIIFYNSQIIDSGALTEQYLDYFIEKKYKVLFIIPDHKKTKLGKGILRIIEKNAQIILFIPNSNSPLLKVLEIENEIAHFGAQTAFLHFTPSDVIGFASFCNFDAIKRYFIVHNDHTFWFGKNCSDYFIEFRKFGYLLAVQRRGINSEKIYHLPYYPIIQKKTFEGFPVNVSGKVIGFSGANLYKYYLDPELNYFYAIKDLLLQNKNFIFFLAGAGNKDIIEKFIYENQLQDRFFLLGRRDDFYELVSNIDILFESYPFKGGLTVLYGVENHKAITGIGNNLNASGCIEDFFDLTSYQQPQNFKDFIIEADYLIKNETARKLNSSKFDNSKYNKKDFDSGLSNILNGFLPSTDPIYNERLKLNDNYYLEEYLKLPNAEYEFYYRKLFQLKSIIHINERMNILIHLFRLKPDSIKKRIVRHLILALFGI